METRTEEHRVTVTQDEMDERASEALSIVASLTAAAEVAKGQRARLKLLGEVKRTGKELRTVEVTDFDDMADRKIRTITLLTGERVAERDMTLAEFEDRRQTKIPGAGPKPKPAPKAPAEPTEADLAEVASVVRLLEAAALSAGAGDGNLALDEMASTIKTAPDRGTAVGLLKIAAKDKKRSEGERKALLAALASIEAGAHLQPAATH